MPPFYRTSGTHAVFTIPMGRTLAAAAGGAALALAWTGPAAAAPVMEPLKPCYVSVKPSVREPVNLRAGGFTANATIDISINGVLQTGVPADAAGSVSGPGIVAPFEPTGSIAPFTVTLAEEGAPQNTVSASSKVAGLALTVRPRRARPSSRVRFRGLGFTAPRPVWAHYLFHGRLRKTVRFVRRSRGDCGAFSVRARQIPVRRPHTGEWTLQVDQQRIYSAQPDSVYVRLGITVARTLAGA
jgi:hypothetical protein